MTTPGADHPSAAAARTGRPLTGDVIAQLDAEWAHLVVRHRDRVPAAWQAEPSLATHRTLSGLLAAVHDPTVDAGAELVALTRLAAGDLFAARVTLQAVLPIIKRLARRTSRPEGVDHETWCAALLAAAWGRVRDYPTHRPGSVAGNLKLDTLRDARRGLGVHRATHPTVAFDTSHHDNAAEPGAVERPAAFRLLDTLHHARQAGVISPDDADLVAATHITDTPAAALADRYGIHPGHLRRRRARIEATLTANAALLAA